LKLFTGTAKVLLFLFLQRNTQRKYLQDRNRTRRRCKSDGSSDLISDLLIAALFNGGSQ
jgi:hypothetical protein